MASEFMVFLALLIVSVGVCTALRGRRRVLDTLDSTFEALRFNTPQGVVTGESVRVVKIARDSMPFSYDDVYRLGKDYVQSTSFWYCVGPGPSYFLALPTVSAGFGKASVRWIVRPLTKDRMHAALQGGKDALHLAFGDVTEIRG